MAECWLKTNRRALCLGTIIPAVIFLLGLGIFSWRWPEWSLITSITRILGGSMMAFGALMVTFLLAGMFRPRVAYKEGNLLLYLRDGPPIEVPIEIVEVFFRGQGPSHVGQGAVSEAETSNIVIRLAEKAEEWHKVQVKPALGEWCEGYITLRGAWCQPIDREALEHLNSKLVLTKRQLKAEQENSAVA